MPLSLLVRAAIIAGCLAPLGCAQAWAPTRLDDLVAAVAVRTSIGHDVAATKYPVQRPVEDRERETQILIGKREQAQALGLDPDAVETFYRHMIEANKLVQYLDFHRFALGTPPPQAPSLEELRIKIDAADATLLALWPKVAVLRGQADCAVAIAQAIERQDSDDKASLTRALVGFCQALPSH